MSQKTQSVGIGFNGCAAPSITSSRVPTARSSTPRCIGEQSLASNEIAHQVEMIAGMSEGNSKVIGQTASTTDELSSLAGQLSQSVDRFRL